MNKIAYYAFVAGCVYTGARYTFRYLRKDVDGLGSIVRTNKRELDSRVGAVESLQDRRWKHLVAMLMEASKTAEQKKAVANLLKEDAWHE